MGDRTTRQTRLLPRALPAVASVVVPAVVVLAAAPAAADTGPWVWPLAGRTEVSRPFAPPEHRYGSGHRGVDLPGSPGEPVLAAGAGRVSWAGPIAGRGVVVVVHGQLRTTYEPVEADVEVGRLVGVGEPLGRLSTGHAGCPVAACLHWGLRRGEPYLDPLQLVGGGPVRLLPLSAPDAGDDADGGAGGARGTDAGGPGGRPVGGAARAPEPPVPAEPAWSEEVRGEPAPAVDHGPWWSLRAADAPAGGAALAALLAGLALLAGPRRPPHGPSAAAPAAPPPLEEHPETPPPGPPVDLTTERTRRRPAA